jgi:hypothetical protein
MAHVEQRHLEYIDIHAQRDSMLAQLVPPLRGAAAKPPYIGVHQTL